MSFTVNQRQYRIIEVMSHVRHGTGLELWEHDGNARRVVAEAFCSGDTGDLKFRTNGAVAFEAIEELVQQAKARFPAATVERLPVPRG